MTLKNIYIIFIGLMLAVLVGVGIDAFYVRPKAPEYNNEVYLKSEIATPSAEEIRKEKELSQKYQEEYKEYQKILGVYNRNVSVITSLFSVILLVISLTWLKKLELLSDGLLLGGLLTQAYSVILGFQSQNSQFRFLVVLVCLIISLIVGYIKFIKKK